MKRPAITTYILTLAGLLLCCVSSGHAETQKPKAFTATYKAQYSGLSVEAVRELQYEQDGSLKLTFRAQHFLANINETSHFLWQDNGQLQPQHYGYSRKGLGRDRYADLTFDWQQKIVTNDVQNKPWTMAITDQTLDKLSYQLQLRADLLNQKKLMSYAVADGGRLKTYDFQILGEEVLDTPLGQLNTVKVKRIRKNNKRETLLWLAKDWDHLLVKIWQREKDGKHYEINLAEANVGGHSVTGL